MEVVDRAERAGVGPAAGNLAREIGIATRAAPSNRVLMVAPQPFYQDRGTPIALRHVIEALVQLGYEIDLISFPLGRRFELAHVRHEPVGNPLRFKSIPIGFSIKKLFFDAILLVRAYRQLRAHPYRCVHAVEEAAYLMWLPCRMNRVPLVYDMQSSIPEQLQSLPVWRTRAVQWLLRRLEGALVRRVDYVVASAGLGAYVRALAPSVAQREWHFPDRTACKAARPGARELEDQTGIARRELDLPVDAPTVVYCGNFEPYQGLPLLLGAVPLVVAAAPRTLFVLVGAADQRRIDDMAAALAPQLRKHVRILGTQPRERVQRYLMAADVLVSPRMSGKNAPLKIFDYLGTSRPIVATDITAHRAVLQDDKAVLVEPVAEALAQGIVRVLHDHQLARRMANATSALRRERLTWPAFVAEVDQIYGALAARAR